MEEGCYYYKGFKFNMLFVPPENLDAMSTFEVRADDIFLVTYAKCGTHWACEIINLILTGGDPDKIDRTCMEACLEMSYLKDITDFTSTVPYYKTLEAKTSRRVILTHLPKSLLPPQVFTKKPKVIYVTRNPKDCGVSMYHAFKEMGMPDSDWDGFVNEWTKQDNLLFGGFFTHVLDFWKHRHDSNLLFMKYEDMKKDPRGSIVRFADHLDVVHHSEVNNMKKTYDNIEKNIPGGVFLTKILGKAPFIRKGQIGDWKNHFTVAQNEQFDVVIRENLHTTGLVFDFE
ncbi:sulfotransferase 1B1-like [Antedon mediterranea]|uniref:sulfotransferase 1B1-like n=1 Tax=Antedon mediterranea TaxID=105859 RepID=UPI003AF4F16D